MLHFCVGVVVGTATDRRRGSRAPSLVPSQCLQTVQYTKEGWGVVVCGGTVPSEDCTGRGTVLSAEDCTGRGSGLDQVEGIVAEVEFSLSHVPKTAVSPSVCTTRVGCCSTRTRSWCGPVWRGAVLLPVTATPTVVVEHCNAAPEGECRPSLNVGRVVGPTQHCRLPEVALPPHTAAQTG